MSKPPAHSNGALPTQPGRNGGVLRVGGTNAGGPGRPSDVARMTMRRMLEKRLPVIDQILSGEKVFPAYTLEGTEYQRASSVKERIAALDFLAKYGIGTQKEIDKTIRALVVRVVRETKVRRA